LLQELPGEPEASLAERSRGASAITRSAATGIAAITVYKTDNAIVLVRGANASLSPADLDAAESAFAGVDVCSR
jgi:hypothetical protein